MHALVVDDDPNSFLLVTEALRLASFETHAATTGHDALRQVESNEPDVVILEAALDDLDGFAVCDRIRGSGSRVPLVFLSSRDSVEDRVRGLDLGADDYIGKPFSVAELVARVRAVLRRTQRLDLPAVLRFSDLELDTTSHRVMRGPREITLSPHEFKVLQLLLENQPRVLSRAQLLDRVWGHDFAGGSTVVESCISGLRRKLGRDMPPLIHTVRGFGYRLSPS